MTNGQINRAFLKSINTETRDEILESIGKHYGIEKNLALVEVVDDEAEHLLDYLTGSVRAATSGLMQAHGFTTGWNFQFEEVAQCV
jgi:hypothetical protein